MCLRVEADVWRSVYPVFKDHEPGASRKDDVNGSVIVTEDEEVNFMSSFIFSGKLIQRFLLIPEYILLVMRETAVA